MDGAEFWAAVFPISSGMRLPTHKTVKYSLGFVGASI